MVQNCNDREPETDLTLKSLMESAELTEPELSRRIHVGGRIINDWKNRRKIPRLDNAAAMARELGVSLKTVCRALGIDISGVPDDGPCREEEDRPT